MLYSSFHRRPLFLIGWILFLFLLMEVDYSQQHFKHMPPLPPQTVKIRKKSIPASDRQKLLPGESSRFICVLTTQADVSPALKLSSKKEKADFIFTILRHTADSTQPPVVRRLTGYGCSLLTSYTVVNAVLLQCNSRMDTLMTIEQADMDQDVARIESDLPFPLAADEMTLDLPEVKKQTAELPWNLNIIGTAEVWAQGFRGKNVVIGNQDTGIQWDHPALIHQYRGWSSDGVDHNYHWWDAVHSRIGTTENPCGYSSAEPCDDRGHGTHTMGIAVGDDGDLNRVGVAPEAKWIGCRNMDSGIGRPSTYLECFDFFLAPWDLQKQNPNPDLSPDIINNSWSCPQSEGCATESLLAAVNHVRAAGMVISVAAGNSGGNGCGSIDEEPAIFDAVTTIGSTDSLDAIAISSSRGPVLADQSGRIKPDLSAPGVAIYSSWKDSSYNLASGTSMATPHFSGAVAVLLSAFPEMKGDVDRIEWLFFQSAVRKLSLTACGGIPGDQIPNSTYGWGRIYLPIAIKQAGYREKAFLPLMKKP